NSAHERAPIHLPPGRGRRRAPAPETRQPDRAPAFSDRAVRLARRPPPARRHEQEGNCVMSRPLHGLALAAAIVVSSLVTPSSRAQPPPAFAVGIQPPPGSSPFIGNDNPPLPVEIRAMSFAAFDSFGRPLCQFEKTLRRSFFPRPGRAKYAPFPVPA